MEQNIQRKFSALVANMLDAEKRQSWEEFDAFKKMVSAWQEKFNLSFDNLEAGRNISYNYYNLEAIVELRTAIKTPTWFKWMVCIIRDVFGVGILLSGKGTKAEIITRNEELLAEIFDFAETIQNQMLLYYQNDKSIGNKPQYFSGFINGVYKKLCTGTSTSLVLKEESKKAVDWYKSTLAIRTRRATAKVRRTDDYERGEHDGQHRGSRVHGQYGTKLLSA